MHHGKVVYGDTTFALKASNTELEDLFVSLTQ